MAHSRRIQILRFVHLLEGALLGHGAVGDRPDRPDLDSPRGRRPAGVGQPLYGPALRKGKEGAPGLALRTWAIVYLDPSQRLGVVIRASVADFCRTWVCCAPAVSPGEPGLQSNQPGRPPRDDAAAGQG